MFTITASEINEYLRYSGLVFTVPKNSAVILNIAGSEDLDLSPSFIRYAGKQIDMSNKELAGNIIINILDSSNVTTNGVKATILAPNSNIKATANHHQEGQVIAHSLTGDLKIGTTLFSLDASRKIETIVTEHSIKGRKARKDPDPWLDRVNAFLGIESPEEAEPQQEPEPVQTEEAADPKDYDGMFAALMAALSAAGVVTVAENGYSKKKFSF